MRLVPVAFALTVALFGLAAPVYAGAALPGTPEIDPASMASALALLTGGCLMLTDRYFRK